jgi:HAD superfamily hydrolase (TIGR01549 family)
MTQSDSLADENSIDLIIFDCDGVLVDSEILSQRVLLNMLKELGVNATSDYFYTHFLGYNFEHVTAKVFADFSIKLTNDFRETYRKTLINIFSSELNTTTDLKWLLSQLNVNSCVATSGSPEKIKHSLKYTELDHYFNDRVFTSSEVENGKPAPDLFLHAANKMGVLPENCLVIEDSPTGIKAALAADMRVIRYTGASHMKNRKITTHLLDGISTIAHWDQLFEKYSSLNSSLKIER